MYVFVYFKFFDNLLLAEHLMEHLILRRAFFCLICKGKKSI